MNSKISLAGDLGSGKSTVSALLTSALGAEYYSTGSIVRKIAEERGMTVVELNKYMETHPEIDTMIDDGIRALSHDPRALVIDSRMAWHFTEGTFRVYLSTDIETSALRIMNAGRKGEHAATLGETVADTRARRLSEQKRYSERYGVDIKDLSNYSLVVDTTVASPDEVAAVIISSLHAWESDPSYSRVLVSPERLNFPDDADGADIPALAEALERGEELPAVLVSESEGEFYIESGAPSALAYAFNMHTFVPARLVPRREDGRKFVRMKNSI
ncbi:MAG: cytidylate kinase family protein [Clostridia bacterium]|nr:cytidylate kinase family protein [Clostridia bacterium]